MNLGLRQILGLWFALLGFGVLGERALADPPAVEPWFAEYTGVHVTGRHVVAYWFARRDNPLADLGPHQLNATLRGGRIVTDDRWGACLLACTDVPNRERGGGALVPHAAPLSLPGAFTIELWICPNQAWSSTGEAILVDKKYADPTDYQLALSVPDRSGRRTLLARLGFGQESDSWTSIPMEWPEGRWRHVAFAYDGAGGGWWFVDGQLAGFEHKPGRYSVAPGQRPLCIGDRIGSYYHTFPGRIARVRITQGRREFRLFGCGLASDRTAFRRAETNAWVVVAATNWAAEPCANVVLEVHAFGATSRVHRVAVPPGGVISAAVAVATSWRPDSYTVDAELRIGQPIEWRAGWSTTLCVRPRPPPLRMPVVMWGIYSPREFLREWPRLKELGFTHCLGVQMNERLWWTASEDTSPVDPDELGLTRRALDVALASDLGLLAKLAPGAAMRDEPSLLRIDAQGRPVTNRPNICAASPALTGYVSRVGRAVGRAYGAHPAFEGALLHTEVRDAATICYHPHDLEAARRAGFERIPTDVTKSGTSWSRIQGFPSDRVVPDDDARLAFLRWWWKHGDGWNDLNTILARALREGGMRPEAWTFHDPAVRVASTWGSGGEVDVLSHWTYTYPDPIRIGLATDELFAMARGAPRPTRVMKMTQIIWYRSQTAPARTVDVARAAALSPWEDTDPDARFLTIAPAHLREAFWCKLARPIAGIMYHGWQALVPVSGHVGSYRFTHPETQNELRRLLREVLEPLGPTLLQLGDAPRDAALLESFAAQMYAGRGTYGWGRGWAADLWHAATWAHLQLDILYDETILRDGLDAYKLLLLPDCDVLQASVARRIAEFQRRGGIVVGDERLAPAIRPDICLPVVTRSGRADEDQQRLIELGQRLLEQLGARYTRRCWTSSPYVIPHLRQHRETDYIILVNDRRTYGSYVGSYGLVMEAGMPSDAEVMLRRADGRAYDLLLHREVPVTSTQGAMRFPIRLGPGEGRVIMITPRPIASVVVNGPLQARRAGRIEVAIRVVDPEGKPVSAVVPLRVEIHDPDLREAEGTGWYGVRDGQMSLPLDIAPNDTPGPWTVRVRELASNHEAIHSFEVLP